MKVTLETIGGVSSENVISYSYWLLAYLIEFGKVATQW